MTQTLDSSTVADAVPRRRRRWRRAAAMLLLSLLLFLVGLLQRRLATPDACCAIDCLDTPDPAACERREREKAERHARADRAEKAAVGAFAGSAIALAAAGVLLIRR